MVFEAPTTILSFIKSTLPPTSTPVPVKDAVVAMPTFVEIATAFLSEI